MNAENAYLFRHALLRDAAYQLQLPGDRSRLHGIALQAIESIAGGRPGIPRWEGRDRHGNDPHPSDSYAEELEEHARLAAAPEGIRKLYLIRAAEQAERLFRNEAAGRYWSQLGELLEGAERGAAFQRAGIAFYEVGEIARAESAFVAALELERAAGQRSAEASTLGNLAGLYADTARIDEALRAYEKALEMHRELGNRRSIGRALANLALLWLETGRASEAEQALNEALAIHREVRQRRDEGVTLGSLGTLYLNAHRTAEARTAMESALAIHREIGNRRSEAITLVNLGVLSHRSGRHQEARKAYTQALELNRALGNRSGEGLALGYLARTLADDNRLAEAEEMYRIALSTHRELRNRRAEGSVLGNLADVCVRSGRPAEARRHLEEAIAAHREVRNRPAEGGALCDCALLLVSLSEPQLAREFWRQGTAILGEIGDESGLKAHKERWERAWVEPAAGTACPAPPVGARDPVSNARPLREIRARFDDRTITVYQAFRPEIAEPAARTGRFGGGFSLDRMTWIKPSFFWMMHRSGWASKPGQERVLAIDITRDGFEWALARGVLSHFDASLHSSREAWNRDLSQSPVRIQWDPERGRRLELLPWRSLQVGLQGEAASRYVSEWIVSIRDVTDLAHRLRDSAEASAPIESPYPLPPGLAARIGT